MTSRFLSSLLVGLAFGAWPTVSRASTPPIEQRVEFKQSETLYLTGRVVLDRPIHVPAGVTLTLFTDETIEMTGSFEVRGGGVFSALSHPTAFGSRISISTPVGFQVAPVLGGIKLILERTSDTSLLVVDVQGRVVERLRETRLAGEHIIDLGQRNVRPGVYFYRVSVPGAVRAGKTLVLR